MKNYLDIVQKVLSEGVLKENRTGVSALTIAGAMFEHNMSTGFPLLTTKAVPMRLVAAELEFFIKGNTDKHWLSAENNHIWDEWANPKKAPYGHDAESKQRMLKERDLGAIYGFQWRHFNAEYENFDTDYTGKGVDQLQNVINTLKTNPNDRRMIVSAWNPLMLDQMALPPCHYLFQITTINGKLNLMWNQRSVDTLLGLPFNIASYALLLHLLAKESGLEEGKLIGFLGDVHIYENHIEGAKEQLSRDPGKYPLPKLQTDNFTSIFDWKYQDTQVIDYKHYPRIKFDIAI
ncbi:thymidylate synthase [Candidatus Uhrbacteria bacterium CG_4_10_14_0_2_um_filter_41_7]|uniref:Thymidylate synthase n=1 Tax=Candidatus Uhrbacteria bacterium CG_4_9_14_3_um_filter_41_35 TaxID=1975034 RepID=A0A2M7XFW3_9BACT|nr:MAG: thymidylate synthase [Candidatus Uhrbacteria bacterium CG11_big_fil_rev_8_21_14_0_20_41_9]PIZ54588.1 MAG: thymidylate synthase [Candidatus Uhrbacteria bacterium CG_4_10_14_0_2_um_filter_41_7]PJA46749.1 MAG: thymidylate synthase [Candidatus Uhrbacteria bacterium CG_4_9_14_3_um_filter_41_35]